MKTAEEMRAEIIAWAQQEQDLKKLTDALNYIKSPGLGIEWLSEEEEAALGESMDEMMEEGSVPWEEVKAQTQKMLENLPNRERHAG